MTLRRVPVDPLYTSDDDPLHRFYVPALAQAVRYDRAAGYFRASSLAAAADGLETFLLHGGTVRLLCGVDMDRRDIEAVLAPAANRAELDVLADHLNASEIGADARAALGWLVATRRMVIRVVLPRDPESTGYFHLKLGLLKDLAGHTIAFQGSVNETGAGWIRNCEGLDVHTSWGDRARTDGWRERFDRFWEGTEDWVSYDLPEAVAREIVRWADGTPRPLWADIPEALPVDTTPLVSDVQRVKLQPHQEQVVQRLIFDDRSWLVADEVGLGKTISAGEALRRIVVEQTKRALILAPANVTVQWQEELVTKVGIPAARLESANSVRTASGESVASTDPFRDARWQVLVASSHLLRRDDWRPTVLAAGPWDVIVVDEAHHARSRDKDPAKHDYNKLLQLLRKVRETHPQQRMWLLTATPMQTTPNELYDLIWLCGMRNVSHDEFHHYYRTVADPAATEEELLAVTRVAERVLTGRRVRTPADLAAVTRLAKHHRLSSPEAHRLRKAVEKSRIGTSAELPSEVLRDWLDLAGPVRQYVTRHTRRTLLRYHDEGLLSERIARRNVRSVSVRLTSSEQAVYDSLDAFIARLWEAERESTRGIGFVLAVYRRRLTSSWTAIERTLQRLRDNRTLDVDDEDAALLGADEVGAIYPAPVALQDIDSMLAAVRKQKMEEDSKVERLLTDIRTLRSEGRSVIVFTQFADTVDHLRDILTGSFGRRTAVFTGAGVELHQADRWCAASKADLMEKASAGEVDALLATDAASEGINLQMFSTVINFDMPWNPARVEQRVGRIDRLGQRADEVEVLNYFVANTIEEQVYEALLGRVNDWDTFIGEYQPILGAVEQAIEEVALLPQGSRRNALKEREGLLAQQRADAQASGVHLGDDDDWPVGQGVGGIQISSAKAIGYPVHEAPGAHARGSAAAGPSVGKVVQLPDGSWVATL